MVDPSAWKNSLSLAKLGDMDSANRVGTLLFQWAHGELPRSGGPDEEEMVTDFAEHMVRDQFGHIPDRPPACLDAFLRKCWRRFVIDRRESEQRRRAHLLLSTERVRAGDEDVGSADMDELAGRISDLEGVILLREEIADMRAEVARLSPIKQQIFALFFDEDLREPEVARVLQMKTPTVTWHVFAIRRHLRQWRDGRAG